MAVCPGYISNHTSDVCIGDVLITSPEFGYMLLLTCIIILGCIFVAAQFKKMSRDDAVHAVGEKESEK